MRRFAFLPWLGLAGFAATLSLAPLPAQGAERLLFYYGLLSRRLDVSSLETFAETGRANRQLRSYFAIAGVDAEDQAAFRQALQEPAPIDPLLLTRVLYTNIGDDILTRFLGDLLRTESGLNGKHSLRAALILAARDPEGLTTLNFLRYLPTNMRVDLPDVLTLGDTVQGVVDATKFAIDTLEDLSNREARQEERIVYDRLPALEAPGDFGTETARWTLIESRQNPVTGEPTSREFYVNLAYPQRWRDGKTPVLILSHGLSSNPEYFDGLARHLASHGYLVAMPQHPGSDIGYRDQLIEGLVDNPFDLGEFIDRPLDITAVIDELERRNGSDFGGRLDLENVGVGGHSFGGYTALAVAGATIDFEFLKEQCSDRFSYLNISLLLQCQALDLPRQAYRFRDERVQSVAVLNPVNSSIYGPKGLSRVQIPTIVISGSHDPATPAVFEQFRTFPWLAAPERYLGLIEGQAHVNLSDLDVGISDTINSINGLTLADPQVIGIYGRAFSLAFFETYTAQNPAYRPYLRASYAQYLSQGQNFPLHLISAAMTPALAAEISTLEATVGEIPGDTVEGTGRGAR